MDDIVLPPGYDPADDLSLLLNFLRDCYAPGPVQVALPRLLEATRLSCISLPQTLAPPTPSPTDEIKEIDRTYRGGKDSEGGESLLRRQTGPGRQRSSSLVRRGSYEGQAIHNT